MEKQQYTFDPSAIYKTKKGSSKAIYKILCIERLDFRATGYNFYGTWKTNVIFGSAQDITPNEIVTDLKVIAEFEAEMKRREL